MAGILIYSDNNKYAQELLTAGSKLAAELGSGVAAIAINNDNSAEILAGRGAHVYKINDENINQVDSSGQALALKQAMQKLSAHIILLSSDRRGKEIAGGLAQLMDAGCLTDVKSIALTDGQIECARNALGGATEATQSIVTENKVIAITPKSFDVPEQGSGSIEGLNVDIFPSPIRLIHSQDKSVDSADIESAKTLVVVGQGLEDKSQLAIIDKLANLLGGVVACSKPVATDKKWLPEERVVGLSGKKCKPDLAIIMGVSGQVQFTVGIRDAKTIVAVNTDENANIMQMADYVMAADLKDVTAGLIKAISNQ